MDRLRVIRFRLAAVIWRLPLVRRLGMNRLFFFKTRGLSLQGFHPYQTLQRRRLDRQTAALWRNGVKRQHGGEHRAGQRPR